MPRDVLRRIPRREGIIFYLTMRVLSSHGWVFLSRTARKGDFGSSVRKKITRTCLMYTAEYRFLFKQLRGRFRMNGFKIFNYDDIHVVAKVFGDRDKKCWFG